MIICDINKCFGCGVCENICTANACTLKTDNEGFLSPVIDDSKCSKCNLCKSKCPSLFQTTSYPIIGAYAYYTNNLELRTSSSSGGIFSDIATYIINEKVFPLGSVILTDDSDTTTVTPPPVYVPCLEESR